MNMLPYRFLSGLAVIMLLIAPGISKAQKSVWNSGKNAKETAGGKVAKTAGKLKSFKNHLQTWGLDTSYNSAFLAGGKLNSDGWSGSMYFVRRKSYKHSNVWQLHFSEIKHEKQTKQKSVKNNYPQFGNTTPYVFGKVNNLYTLQVGLGKENLLLPAVLNGNLSVSFRYTMGFSLAMLKPYYLKLIYLENNGGTDTVHLEHHKYSIADSGKFLDPNNIFGASAWDKGLNETSYVPGAYFETAIAIIPGRNKNFVQVVTLGINGAFYAKPLTIMADLKAYPWQVSLFAGLGIGKRWK